MRVALGAVLSTFTFLAVVACSTSSGASSSGPITPSDPEGESEESKEKPKDVETVLVAGVDAENFAESGWQLTHLRIVVKVDGAVATDVSKQASTGPLFPHEMVLAAPAAKLDA